MPTKAVVMLDGGHLRVHAKRACKNFDPDYIEKIGHACRVESEVIHRIMYYDCAPISGSAILLVSGERKTFTGRDDWLKILSYKDLFSVRLGRPQVPRIRSQEGEDTVHTGRAAD